MAENKEDRRKQYLIAIIPPAPFFDHIHELKNFFSERFNSWAALRSPPHITLHMPFKWPEEREDELVGKLTGFASAFASFHLEFNNYGAFPPRVIFVGMKQSSELEALQKELMRFCKRELGLFNSNYKDRPFNPHITLAFRDLTKSAFREAWEEFKEKAFEGSFEADCISLLKHNGKVWEKLRDFPLSYVM